MTMRLPMTAEYGNNVGLNAMEVPLCNTNHHVKEEGALWESSRFKGANKTR